MVYNYNQPKDKLQQNDHYFGPRAASWSPTAGKKGKVPTG
jgi:hypothetical protein